VLSGCRWQIKIAAAAGAKWLTMNRYHGIVCCTYDVHISIIHHLPNLFQQLCSGLADRNSAMLHRARYCHDKLARSSVRPSVTLQCCSYIVCIGLKIIMCIIRLGFSLSAAPIPVTQGPQIHPCHRQKYKP